MLKKDTFALTPPMGWNSWDCYGAAVNEEQLLGNAEYVRDNLKEYGWEYIVVDIEWYAHGAGTQRDKYQYIPFSKLEMDEYSRLQPNHVQHVFPFVRLPSEEYGRHEADGNLPQNRQCLAG